MAKRHKSNNRPIIIVVIVVLVVGLTWYFWPTGEEAPTSKTSNNTDNGGGNEGTGFEPGDNGGGSENTGGGSNAKIDPRYLKAQEVPNMSKSEARDAYKQGMALLKAGEIIKARTELSNVYFSDALDKDTQDGLRKTLTDIANDTLFSGKIYKDDPYVYDYIFQPGDILRLVIGPKKEALRVPDQMIMKINGIDAAMASTLRPDAELKFIRGPFHAVISKNDFTMDIFLQRDDKPKTFVRRLYVGLGKNGGTPEGLWRVRLGNKMPRAPWTPVAKMGTRDRGDIRWEDNNPEYPFGKEGYWIGLEGLDDNTMPRGGYGIHGTNEPDSIGKAYSLGCIRLVDEDIEFVFFTLYEFHSTVLIKS